MFKNAGMVPGLKFVLNCYQLTRYKFAYRLSGIERFVTSSRIYTCNLGRIGSKYVLKERFSYERTLKETKYNFFPEIK